MAPFLIAAPANGPVSTQISLSLVWPIAQFVLPISPEYWNIVRGSSARGAED